MKTKTEKSGRGRPRTGQLIETGKGWVARVTVEIDGERVQKRFPLGTADRAAAKAKLRKLLKDNAPSKEQAAASLTVADFCDQWLARREAQQVTSVGYERRHMELIWLPRIGSLALDRVSVADVQEVLDDLINGSIKPEKRKHHKAAAKPYSRESVMNIRATIVGLFRSAERNELVTRNAASLTEVLPMPDGDGLHKTRATLTDPEFGQLLACAAVDPELKMAVLISRTVGGLRSGDIKSLDWSQFSPGFETLSFVRRKTKKKRPLQEVHAVPESVRPFVAEWHARNGAPQAGPVLPVRFGPRAGESKGGNNTSYASRLRRGLRVAGVTRFELHTETKTTRPVDFHSTRRAYAQALLATGVNAQTAMALTGHASPQVHQLYADAHTVRVLPAGAVPDLDPASAFTLRRKADNDPILSQGVSYIRKVSPQPIADPASFPGLRNASGFGSMVCSTSYTEPMPPTPISRTTR